MGPLLWRDDAAETQGHLPRVAIAAIVLAAQQAVGGPCRPFISAGGFLYLFCHGKNSSNSQIPDFLLQILIPGLYTPSRKNSCSRSPNRAAASSRLIYSIGPQPFAKRAPRRTNDPRDECVFPRSRDIDRLRVANLPSSDPYVPVVFCTFFVMAIIYPSRCRTGMPSSRRCKPSHRSCGWHIWPAKAGSFHHKPRSPVSFWQLRFPGRRKI